MKKNIVLLFLLSLTKDSYAYLDPASGNALICLIISILGALIFYIKKVFYKIINIFIGKPISHQNNDKLVLFSEGKSYFFTFKPIIEELIKKEISFSYMTMDIEDPALLIDNEYMHSRYIGEGNKAYAKISSYSADLMLSTTPNIGCKDFPIKKSKKIKKLVHVWHSVCDTSFYNLGALDFYDVALTVGPWVEKSIREIEQIRGIPHKEVISCGLPYLDELKKELESNPAYRNSGNDGKDKFTILIAPSWGDKNCLKYYGIDFIKELASRDNNIIIRPHPQSLKVEKQYIDTLQNEFTNYKNITFDFDYDGLKSMAKSSLLISDKSSIRFDYVILFEKPVLTLDVPQKYLKIYESSLIKEHFEDNFADKIGIRLDLSKINEIISTVYVLLDYKVENIKEINQELIPNFKHSASEIVNYLYNAYMK